MPRFDLKDMLRAIAEHRVTHAVVPQPVAMALARHPLVERFDLSSLEILGMGGAPSSAELERACAERLGCEAGAPSASAARPARATG